MDKARDITADLCDLYQLPRSDSAIPMYSYSRPASQLWQAVFSGLIERGWSEAEAVEWLQSKNPRWLLDDSLGDAIAKLGDDVAAHARKVRRAA